MSDSDISSSDSDLETTDSSSYESSFAAGSGKRLLSQDDVELAPPKRKRYRKAIRDGFNKRSLQYHQSRKSEFSLNDPVTTVVTTSATQLGFCEPIDDALHHNAHASISVISSNERCSSISSADSDTTDDDASESSVTSISVDSSDISDDDFENQINEFDTAGNEIYLNTGSQHGDAASVHVNNVHKRKSLNKESHAVDSDLYPGSRHTNLSSAITVMMFVMKHGLSKEAFSDLISLIGSHLPVSSEPYFASIYKLKEFLKQIMDFKEPDVHKFCERCHRLIDVGPTCISPDCLQKKARGLEFYDLRIDEQLKRLFQDATFCELLTPKQRRADTAVSDICDGMQYKKLMLNQDKASRNVLNLTFTMNTDGVTLFSSSKKGNLWPIYLAINELPVKLRFSKKYILPSYIYCHTDKPNMLSYMKPLTTTLRKLSEEGLEIQTAKGQRLIKAHLLAVAADLPAKALVFNMKQFNGKFGCSYCMDEGEGRPGCPMHRFWPFKENSTLRTHQSVIEDTRKVVQLKKPGAVNGIKGASPLLVLRYIDLPKVFVVDWMHCVLLGVVKSIMKLWFCSTNRTGKFYIGNKMNILNRRLLTIQIPDFISRRQRSLEDHSHWKATECREWLFHFSIPVVEGILQPEAYAHYALLVSAMHLLNKDQIHLDEITYAEQLLRDFCQLYPEMYGTFEQTMNVHMLKHLPNFVRMYGPLFTTSCFGFESMNCHLKSMVHGTRFVSNQVCFAVGMIKALPLLYEKLVANNIDSGVQSLARKLFSGVLRETTDGNHTILGKQTKLLMTEAEEGNIMPMLQLFDIEDAHVNKFYRLRTTGGIYYSKEYERTKTRNSYTVVTNDGSFGVIHFFISAKQLLFAMMEKLEVISSGISLANMQEIVDHAILCKYINMSLCEHIKKVRSLKEMRLIPTSTIKTKCVFIEFRKESDIYVSVPPNLLEHS